MPCRHTKLFSQTGEKRDLMVKASTIDANNDTLFRFIREDDGIRLAAVIPIEKVLYVVEVTDSNS